MPDHITIIYHNNCLDGFASALAAYLYFKSKQQLPAVEFVPANHGEQPPECYDHEVFILDFSYPRKTVSTLCQQAKTVTIIDHHISAYRDLIKLDEEHTNLDLHFDISLSGAVLSWNFFQKTEAPLLYRVIQDNDLWSFKLNETRDVISALYAYPFHFKKWQAWLHDEKQLHTLRHEGAIINRVRNKQIAAYMKRARTCVIAGYTVPVVNAPGYIISELLNRLSKHQPFAAGYEDYADFRIWHLRSSGNQGLDVSRIAMQYGGGGHKNASGFRTAVGVLNP